MLMHSVCVSFLYLINFVVFMIFYNVKQNAGF